MVTDVFPRIPGLFYGVNLTFYDKDGVALPTPNSDEDISFSGGTHEFTNVQRTFTPGVDFHCFDLGITFYEKGETWFDDVKLIAAPPDGSQK